MLQQRWRQRQQPRNRKTALIVRPVASAVHVVATEITAVNAAKVVVNPLRVKAIAQQRKQRQQPKPP